MIVLNKVYRDWLYSYSFIHSDSPHKKVDIATPYKNVEGAFSTTLTMWCEEFSSSIRVRNQYVTHIFGSVKSIRI